MAIFLMIVAGHEASLPAMHGDGHATCCPTSSQSHSWSINTAEQQNWCRQHQSSQKVQRQGQKLVIPRPAPKDCRVTRAVRLLRYCQYHHQCLLENKILPCIQNCPRLLRLLWIIILITFPSAKNCYQLFILYLSLLVFFGNLFQHTLLYSWFFCIQFLLVVFMINSAMIVNVEFWLLTHDMSLRYQLLSTELCHPKRPVQ